MNSYDEEDYDSVHGILDDIKQAKNNWFSLPSRSS